MFGKGCPAVGVLVGLAVLLGAGVLVSVGEGVLVRVEVDAGVSVFVGRVVCVGTCATTTVAVNCSSDGLQAVIKRQSVTRK